MIVPSTKAMYREELTGRFRFICERDGYSEAMKWEARAARIYLNAACNAHLKENRTWGLIWARSSKACARVAEQMAL